MCSFYVPKFTFSWNDTFIYQVKLLPVRIEIHLKTKFSSFRVCSFLLIHPCSYASVQRQNFKLSIRSDLVMLALLLQAKEFISVEQPSEIICISLFRRESYAVHTKLNLCGDHILSQITNLICCSACQSCKSDRAFRVGFGINFDKSFGLISGLITYQWTLLKHRCFLYFLFTLCID